MGCSGSKPASRKAETPGPLDVLAVRAAEAAAARKAESDAAARARDDESATASWVRELSAVLAAVDPVEDLVTFPRDMLLHGGPRGTTTETSGYLLGRVNIREYYAAQSALTSALAPFSLAPRFFSVNPTSRDFVEVYAAPPAVGRQRS